jgi:hypothetical protein
VLKDCLWVDIVIVDDISRFHHLNALEPLDLPDELKLCFNRQASGYPVWVDDVGLQPLGLEPYVVPVAVRESLEFLLDGGAVPGAHTVAPASRELREQVQVLSDDLVRVLVGTRDETLDLLVYWGELLELVHVTEPLDVIV